MYLVPRSNAETAGQYGASFSDGAGKEALSCRIALTERHARVTPCTDEHRSLVAAAHRARNLGARTSESRARCPGPVWHRLVSPPRSRSSCRPSTMHAPVSSETSTASFRISASSDGVVGAKAHHAFSGEIRSPRITTRAWGPLAP
jgi:hypothetical protein